MFHFCQENKKTNIDDFTEHMISVMPIYFKPLAKLILDWSNKKNFSVPYRHLGFMVKMGLRNQKVIQSN